MSVSLRTHECLKQRLAPALDAAQHATAQPASHCHLPTITLADVRLVAVSVCADSNKFPFYPAELYHQFHNDFIGAPYGKQYNDLLKSQYEAGKLKRGMCPDMEI